MAVHSHHHHHVLVAIQYGHGLLNYVRVPHTNGAVYPASEQEIAMPTIAQAADTLPNVEVPLVRHAAHYDRVYGNRSILMRCNCIQLSLAGVG